jgi:hypothetical protein
MIAQPLIEIVPDTPNVVVDPIKMVSDLTESNLGEFTDSVQKKIQQMKMQEIKLPVRKAKQLKKIKVHPKVEVLKRGDSMKSLAQVMSPIERMQQLTKDN